MGMFCHGKILCWQEGQLEGGVLNEIAGISGADVCEYSEH